MSEDESNSDAKSSGGESSDSDAGAVEDMGVRLVARSADGTKLVNTIEVYPTFELSV